MFDPNFQAALASFASTSIPFEVIGRHHKRASELERDRTAIELAAYIIGMLKFDGSDICGHREELLRRANKVRVSQGNGAVVFVTETAESIRAAAEPVRNKSYEEMNAEVALIMGRSS